jgi:hypothetical protein
MTITTEKELDEYLELLEREEEKRLFGWIEDLEGERQ